MGTITLDDRDRAVLERLREGDADAESLAERVEYDGEEVDERLPKLAENGLVDSVDGDTYALSDDGVRVLEATPTGAKGNRIDTPPDVETQIQSFDCPPDRAEAIRSAFAFLRYWGTAAESEIIDATYSEYPADFESPTAWWDEFIREHLETLPSIEPPASDGDPWRYADTPTVEKATDDGRAVSGADVTTHTSVKYALEQLELEPAKRTAVREAFDYLLRAETASPQAFENDVYPEFDAGYESAADWWDDVRTVFESLPGVERRDDGSWQYRTSDENDVR